MRISKPGLEFIKLHEGFRSKAYGDPVGVLTIGYGSTNRSQSFVKWWETFKGGKMTKSSSLNSVEAEDALEYTIAHEYGVAVNTFLGSHVVPQHVFDAMVSVVYNCGPGALKWKWASAVRAGQYFNAADLLETTAVTAKDQRTGKRVRLPGLVRRRREEALLMRTGTYLGVKLVPPAPAPTPVTPPVTPTPPRKSMFAVLIELIGNLFRRK